MRGATFSSKNHFNKFIISIHAPRERSDTVPGGVILSEIISIHAPRERSDIQQYKIFIIAINFNPRSSWEERHVFNKCINPLLYFNPRSSWEERLRACFSVVLKLLFQSTLLVRGATLLQTPTHLKQPFQSTLLVRGATNPKRYFYIQKKFQSTLLVRGATKSQKRKIRKSLFQSTLLVRGATLANCSPIINYRVFQSTLLVRGATALCELYQDSKTISIHAPRERSDNLFAKYTKISVYFNPRSSWVERPKW